MKKKSILGKLKEAERELSALTPRRYFMHEGEKVLFVHDDRTDEGVLIQRPYGGHHGGKMSEDQLKALSDLGIYPPYGNLWYTSWDKLKPLPSAKDRCSITKSASDILASAC